MRAMVARQRRVVAAAIAVPLALLAACGVGSQPHDNTSPTEAETGVPISVAEGTVLVSNGTNTVMVGTQPVRYPTTVTDAAWSPDGSRIAFVDADGNICTAHPDGTGRVVLTTHIDGVVRSHPTWLESQILYSQRKADGSTQIMWVSSTGGIGPSAGSELYYGFDGEDKAINEAPSASLARGPGREFAFQHQGSHGHEVWVSDLNQRTPWTIKVADGTEAALSPDGTKVAYVASSGQISVVAATQTPQQPTPPKPVQVSVGVKAPSHRSWSADGRRIAFSTSTDVESVAVGSTPATPTTLAPAPGVPTYLGPARDTIMRIKGSDPVAAAIAASRGRWPTQKVAIAAEDSRASRAIIMSTSNLPVALAGAQWRVWGPLLFTGSTSLDPRTTAELTRVLGAVDPASGYAPEVYLAGDTDVISAQTEGAVRALGYQPVRISGKNSFDTAMSVAKISEPAYVQSVYIVDAHDTASIAAASSGSVGADQVVLLSDGTTLGALAQGYLNALGPDAAVYPVGAAAQAALAASWPGKPAKLRVTPLGGASAAASSVMTEKEEGLARLIVVDKASLTDVIVAIGLAHVSSAAVIVIDPKTSLDPALTAWLSAASAAVNDTVIVDSSSTVGAGLERTIGELVSGPLGYSMRTG